MLSLSEGLLLFQVAKVLSKAHFMVAVLKVMSASGSNCLPPVLGLKTSMVPAFASPECFCKIFSISSSCLVWVMDLKSSFVVVVLIAAML